MPILGVREKVKGHIPGREKPASSSKPKEQKSGIRGQVSKVVHRGSNEAPKHDARPVNELRDPNSFAPPPRRTGTGLAPAPPLSTAKRTVVAAPSKYEDPRGPHAQLEKQSTDPALLEWHEQQGHSQQEEEQAPRGPYRVDTSGLRTDHFAPPPKMRAGAFDRGQQQQQALPAPPSYESATGSRSVPAPPPRANTTPKAGPSLPPRLPPRTNSTATSASGNSDFGQMNEGAVNRLGAAGVSVPGLGIGQSKASPPPPPPARQQGGTPVNELQNRFSKLRTTNAANENAEQPPAPTPAQGTTWAQKQAAIKTASNFNKDPSSVSMSDAKTAAGTANNFRQRHGEQVAAGARSANSLNQKYGVTNRIGAFAASQQRQEEGVEPAKPPPPLAASSAGSPASAVAGKKKPPPPPPKKKPGLGGAPTPASAPVDDGPPPIPLSTRPTF